MLELSIFYEIRKNTEKAFKVLSCVIYTIINHCVCIDYLACELKKKIEIPVGPGGSFKHGDKSYDQILGIGSQDL